MSKSELSDLVARLRDLGLHSPAKAADMLEAMQAKLDEAVEMIRQIESHSGGGKFMNVPQALGIARSFLAKHGAKP